MKGGIRHKQVTDKVVTLPMVDGQIKRAVAHRTMAVDGKVEEAVVHVAMVMVGSNQEDHLYAGDVMWRGIRRSNALIRTHHAGSVTV